MQYGVATEELEQSAATLRADADAVGAFLGSLEAAGAGADDWVVGRAQRAARAFFDTLAQAARGADSGLRDLGNRAAAGAGEYDSVEGRLFPRP
jgi:predicted trehalose synthase